MVASVGLRAKLRRPTASSRSMLRKIHQLQHRSSIVRSSLSPSSTSRSSLSTRSISRSSLNTSRGEDRSESESMIASSSAPTFGRAGALTSGGDATMDTTIHTSDEDG